MIQDRTPMHDVVVRTGSN